MRNRWNVFFAENKTEKVWGYEILLVNNGEYCGKILGLTKNYRCSDHYHKDKHETFILMKGCILLSWEYQGESGYEVMLPGDAFEVPQYMVHSFWGVEDSLILEISTEDKAEDSYRNNESHKMTWKERREMKRLVRYGSR